MNQKLELKSKNILNFFNKKYLLQLERYVFK